MGRLFIEAVTVCVDYGDFLRAVAPFNRPLLDRWIVVTRASDQETREVCRNYSIECLLTEDFDLDGGFSKSHGINRGLEQLQGDGWLMHLDADVAMPFDTRQCLENAHLQSDCIYGCNRLNVTGWEAWQRVQRQGLHSREHGWLVEMRRPDTWVGGVPAGPYTGYAPIGFLQLWSGKESLSWRFPRKMYPTRHGNAARTDCQFAMLWDRRKRHLIPELVVFHLESEDAKMGANWKGRKTQRFGPAHQVEKTNRSY